MNKENHSDVHNICLESLDYYSDQVMTAVTTTVTLYIESLVHANPPVALTSPSTTDTR